MWSSSVITLALLLLFGGAASADTCVFSSGPEFQLKSDTVEWAMKIASGQTCIRGLRSTAVSSITVELISPPQSGKVTVLGPGFSYNAKADIKGRTHSLYECLVPSEGCGEPLKSWSSWMLAENRFSVLGD